MRCAAVLVGLGVFLSTSVAQAQQVTVTAPSTSVSDSFSERFGVGFGVNHPNFFFGFRGPSGGGGTAPPLDGLTVGIPLRGGKVNGSLSLTAGQSFSRGLSTVAPTITLMNGVPGSVFSGTLAPFVTGLVPVVAAGSPVDAPPPVSRVRSMLELGQIQVQKDDTGNARLVVNDPPPRRPRTDPEPEPPRAKSDSAGSFRQSLEKYAGSKR
jgi:hypothetical protein